MSETGPDDKALDQSLVDRCVAGERAAWNEFVRRFSTLVYSAVATAARTRGTSLAAEEADELHNQIFLSFYDSDCRRLQTFKGRCKLSTWVKVVGVNQTIDYLRRRSRQRAQTVHEGPDPRMGPLANASDGRAPADRSLAARREVESLQAAVEQLTDVERTLLERLWIDEADFESIAAELGCSVGAIYTRKTRLLQKLRAQLSGEILDAETSTRAVRSRVDGRIAKSS